MAAPYNDLLSKLEAAYATVLAQLALTGTRGSAAVDVAVLTGLDDDPATLPRIVCHAEDTTDEVVYNTGILRIPTKIHIYSHSADETLAVHRARVAAVADAVITSDRATVLTDAVADFHCYDVQWLGMSADPDGNAFHTIIELSVVCCAADL